MHTCIHAHAYIYICIICVVIYTYILICIYTYKHTDINIDTNLELDKGLGLRLGAPSARRVLLRQAKRKPEPQNRPKWALERLQAFRLDGACMRFHALSGAAWGRKYPNLLLCMQQSVIANLLPAYVHVTQGNPQRLVEVTAASSGAGCC